MKVFITKRIPEEGIQRMRDNGLVVTVREADSIIPDDELRTALTEYDGIVSMLSDNLSADILQSATRTRIIANYAVGTNNIDIKEATRLGIMVTNTPDVLTEATAELAMALLLSASRRIVPADRFTRTGKFTGWGPLLFMGKGLDGCTVGIVGMGRIGQAFARMAAAFNTRIIYHSRREIDVPYPSVDFDTLLRESDVISLHLPLTPESQGMFNRETFDKMKDGVVFVNTSRGPIVDESALVNALTSGKIAFAGLDVYQYEPKITDALKLLYNVVLLPHIGSATIKSRGDMACLVADNILEVLNGRPAITPVN